MNQRTLTATITVATLAIGATTMLPVLAVGMAPVASPAATLCGNGPGDVATPSDDGTPTILGPAALTVADLRTWWRSSGRPQPRRLRIAVDDLIAVYLAEGAAEGVRGDWAFTQAILETGYFTNSDTAINNFAGIAHYDDLATGARFASPIIGVRAQIQLLKKYALGNQAPLARPNVAPRAGARSATWGGLTRTWATSPAYWSSLDSVYQSMLRHAAGSTLAPTHDAAPNETACTVGEVTLSGDYALPIERRWFDEHPDWLTRPHHDYPAIDLPVPVGTPIFAITHGVIVATTSGGRCGVGVILDGDDGARYTYCHGTPGSATVQLADRVRAGQRLMLSGSTGRSTGPHLHLQVEVDGSLRCPQPLLDRMAAVAGATEPEPTDRLPFVSFACIDRAL